MLLWKPLGRGMTLTEKIIEISKMNCYAFHPFVSQHHFISFCVYFSSTFIDGWRLSILPWGT